VLAFEATSVRGFFVGRGGAISFVVRLSSFVVWVYVRFYFFSLQELRHGTCRNHVELDNELDIYLCASRRNTHVLRFKEEPTSAGLWDDASPLRHSPTLY